MSSSLISQLDATSASSFADDSERLEAIAATKALLARLYTPLERMEDLITSQVPLVAELKCFTDLKAFTKWQEYNGGKPINAETLAEQTGSSVSLMRRFMRHLAVEHVLEEVGEDQYAMASFAVGLQSEKVNCFADFALDNLMPCFTALPAFLDKTAYKEPADPIDGLFQFAKNCPGVAFFDYLQNNPREGATFNICMSAYASKRASWLQFFPLEYLLTGSNSSGPFLVDVGGGIGHDIQKVLDTSPDLGDRMVLQDRPEVIASAVCDDSVKRMGYDFFTPQPVKGARVYYLHSVLHDWPYKQAQQILNNLKPAMVPGYSKILINESVIASRKPVPQTVMFDIAMLTLASKERNEADWRELVESVGLKILKIWTNPVARESIIEVELAS